MGAGLAGPISTHFRHIGAPAAAGPNMVLLYSIPLLYYTIQFLICPVFSMIFTENTWELATIGSEVLQDSSQNQHGIFTNNS